MNSKLFKKFLLIWIVSFITFTVICFVVSGNFNGVSQNTSNFWTSYKFIVVMFIGQLVCAWFALKSDSPEKMFYNIPLLSISYAGLLVMLIVGSAFMIIPSFPSWLGIILCLLVFAFTTISIIQANTAAEIVQNVEDKIKNNTFLIRNLTVDAENLTHYAKNETIRQECQKVYEGLRYSDPMTSTSLANIESDISNTMKDFTSAVRTDNVEKVCEIGESLVLMIEDRNRKCKLIK